MGCLYCDGYYLHKGEGFCQYFDEYIADMPKDEVTDCVHAMKAPILVPFPEPTVAHIIT
jgi:hypothetical protein